MILLVNIVFPTHKALMTSAEIRSCFGGGESCYIFCKRL